MSIIKRAIILCTPKTNPNAELAEMVARMDEYQARLVLSFAKNLFGEAPQPGAPACLAKGYNGERDKLAS